MAQENRSTIQVIEAWVFIRDDEEAKLTDLRNGAAEESHVASSHPVGREKIFRNQGVLQYQQSVPKNRQRIESELISSFKGWWLGLEQRKRWLSQQGKPHSLWVRS